MLVELIINLVTGAVDFLLSLLPSWSPVNLSGLTSALSSGPAGTIFDGLAWANWYLPISEMAAIIVVKLGLEFGTYVVRFVVWLLQLFHVAGGGGT
jgi:hypothetical protein